MPDSSQILINLLSTIIFIPINALILWVVIRFFKLKNKKFLTALKTAAAAALVLFVVQQVIGVISEAALTPEAGTGMLLGIGGLILLVTIIVTILVNSYAVKLFYKEKASKAFLVGAVWSVVTWIVSLVIGAIIVGIAIALTLGSSAAGGIA